MKLFECQRCGACCRISGFVHLDEEEVELMAAHLSLDLLDFTARYTQLAPDRKGLCLEDGEGEDCIFLEESGCRVQAVKPGQCRRFPHTWQNPDSLEICPALRAL